MDLPLRVALNGIIGSGLLSNLELMAVGGSTSKSVFGVIGENALFPVSSSECGEIAIVSGVDDIVDAAATGLLLLCCFVGDP